MPKIVIVIEEMKKDGSFAARPMEDLAPFLDRAEFRENMIVEIVSE